MASTPESGTAIDANGTPAVAASPIDCFREMIGASHQENQREENRPKTTTATPGNAPCRRAREIATAFVAMFFLPMAISMSRCA